MFFDRKGLRVLIYRSPIDMRCGFERLHAYCVHHVNAVMDQGHLYVFFGKNRRRMKLLFYDVSGLVQISKRMERDQFMSHAELLGRSEIAQDELKLIMYESVIREPVVDRSLVMTTDKIFSTQREQVAKTIAVNPSLPHGLT